MALEVGSRLGHYDVTALIGEGGMGQVYQATDTKLNRQVALKILPEAFAEDPDRLARFQREAQVLASLNHPNIAAIHGIEDTEGTKALVLELVEGPTLADRIAQGPIPVDEALPIAKQIAEALEAAHEAGVIHRDLKPANIKVRDDGTVKVLDFGLAKALDTTPQGDPSQSPTRTAAATQMGVIMGTAAYMSPEQARGKPVDKRADIWSFGVVLYEMLTGQRAFQGEDVSLTLSAVLQREPDWTAMADGVSSGLDTYIRRCLHKDPRQRVRDIGDVRLALEGVFDAQAATTAAEEVSHGPTRRWVAVAFTAAVLFSALTGLVVWQSARADPARTIRINVATGVTAAQELALSPDGGTLVYVGIDEAGVRQLYRRALDQFDPVVIPGTTDAVGPFFSPDGRAVGFAAGDDLKRVSLDGGRPTIVCSLATGFRGGSWSNDGSIVFGLEGSGLWRVGAVGGAPVPLSTFVDGETLHMAPEILDEDRLVIFTARLNTERGSERLIAQHLDTGDRWVLADGEGGRVTPSGHVIFGRYPTRDLWVARLDAEGFQLASEPVPILEEVAVGGPGSLFTVARDTGAVAYVPAVSEGDALVWVDRSGETSPAAVDPGWHFFPRLSPDGTRVVFGDLELRLWVLDLQRGGRTLIAGSGNYPIWTSDGTEITFLKLGGGGRPDGMFRRRADASAPAEPLLGGRVAPGSWAPAANVLALWQFPANPGSAAVNSNRDVGVLGPDGSVTLVADTAANERIPRFSPDGRWLAYVSDETGRDEVYVQPYPGPGPRELISTNGGSRTWLVARRTRTLLPTTRSLWLDGRPHRNNTSIRGRATAVDIHWALSAATECGDRQRRL